VDIFLSWSQPRSEAVAKALNVWIPLVLQSSRPWLSRDIEKGARWDDVISRKLESCDFGVVCLTPENLHSDWLLFEAGALSKKVNEARVCTYLLELKPSDVTGPLAKFQHTTATKEDTLSLLEALNATMAEQRLDSDRFRQTFEQWWPDLERRLSLARHQPVNASATSRGTDDKIDEILLTVRTLDARMQRAARTSPQYRPSAGALSDGRLRKLFRSANWDDLIPRLIAYTFLRLGGDRNLLQSNPTSRPEAYVHRAVYEVLEGRYEMPPRSRASLFRFLCVVIDTLIQRDNAGRDNAD